MQVPLTIIDDDLNEYVETFGLKIEGDGVSVEIDQASLTIADNDPLPVLDTQPLSVQEGEAQSRPILRLNQASGRDIRPLFLAENQSALAGKDFSVTGREVVILRVRPRNPPAHFHRR